MFLKKIKLNEGKAAPTPVTLSVSNRTTDRITSIQLAKLLVIKRMIRFSNGGGSKKVPNYNNWA